MSDPKRVIKLIGPKRVIKLIGYDSHGYQGHFFFKAKNGKPQVYPIGSEELYEELMSLGTDHDGTAVYADATEEDIIASQQAPKGGDIAASDVRPDTDSAERAPVRKSQVYPIGSEELYEELMSLGTDHDGTAVYADATEEDIIASQQAPKGGDIAASDVRPDTDSAERAPVRKSQVQAPRKIVVGKRAPTPQSGQPTAEV